METDWITLQRIAVETLKWFVRLAVIFGVLTWLMPCNRGMFWWRSWRGAATDLAYWFVIPFILYTAKTWLLIKGLFVLVGQDPGFGALRTLPDTLQALFAPLQGGAAAAAMAVTCVVILLFQDVMLYWIHRGFHGKLGWRFHAVHHSSKSVDWLSAVRFHVVNDLFSIMLADAVVVLLGFPPQALYALVPINMYYSAMVHANLNWTFGPLRFVFASPLFHRWHHVAEGEASSKNFAPTFAFLDVLFGTFYMPAGAIPQNFGTSDNDVPEGFLAQLIYPFWRKRPDGSRIRENAGQPGDVCVLGNPRPADPVTSGKAA